MVTVIVLTLQWECLVELISLERWDHHDDDYDWCRLVLGLIMGCWLIGRMMMKMLMMVMKSNMRGQI